MTFTRVIFINYALNMSIKRITMSNFSKLIAISILLSSLGGCGYSVPNYVDAYRFKNTPDFISIAKKNKYLSLPIKSHNEIAINQNLIAYICPIKFKPHLCLLNLKHQSIATFPIAITSEHESYLFLDADNQLLILTKDISDKKMTSQQTIRSSLYKLI